MDEDDLVGSIFQAAGMLDEDGFDPTTFLSRAGLKYRLANLRAADGTPIYLPSLSSAPAAGQLDSVAGMDAAWLSGTALDSKGAEVPVWDRAKADALIDGRGGLL